MTFLASNPVDKSLQQRILLIAALALILCAYTVVVVSYVNPREAISNLDFWYHISVGSQLRWDDPQTLVNGLYPLGYPFLLHLATQANIDALRFGQFLSWGGGVLLLSACFSLINSLTRHLFFTIAGTLLLLLNIHFLSHAVYEGNDMLAAGLQAMAIVMLWYGTEREESLSFSKPLLILHGIFLGLGYLTRYTALILLPISLVYLVAAYHRSPRKMLQAVALVLIPFLLATSVQLIPSWIVQQNFFFNEQAKNVWFGIFGEQDWASNWGKVPDTVGFREVISIDPARFLRHWLGQLRSAFVSMRLWPLPLHIGWILALPVLAFSRQISLSRRLLLFMLIIVPFAVTALAWLAPRFMLLSLWIQAVMIVWLALWIKNIIPLNERLRMAIVAGVLLLAIIFEARAAADWLKKTPMTRPQEVNSFLRMAGMAEAERTATNDPFLHAVDEADRSRYQQIYFVNLNPKTVEDLLTHPAANDWQYLIIDYAAGFGEYAHLRDAFREEKSLLVPLRLSADQDIFCVMPCLANDSQPLSLTFDNGMQLTGYRRRGSEGEGSLYLYWQTEYEVANSYKISVRIRDASGNEFMQIDNVPQLWTYPTTTWTPHTPIVDFYSWRLENECEDCQIFLVVYEENTSEPVLAINEDGQQVGPLIHLPGI